MHILLSRPAQFSLELHFCVELHTKKALRADPDSPTGGNFPIPFLLLHIFSNKAYYFLIFCPPARSHQKLATPKLFYTSTRFMHWRRGYPSQKKLRVQNVFIQK